MNNAWRSPYSGQAQNNQFPGRPIYTTPGYRAMSIQEIKRAHKLACGLGQDSAVWMPITYAGRAAIARATAGREKEVRVADLMEFVSKYRERKHGDVITFPAWLSEQGRKRLLEIAQRQRRGAI